MKPLIIAPKKVAEALRTEEKKWEHLKKICIMPVLGSVQQRLRALATPADTYVINRENTQWLVEHFRNNWPFNLDESLLLKNPQSKRSKSLKLVRSRIRRFVELTGTPVGNGLKDLWAQIYLLYAGAVLARL